MPTSRALVLSLAMEKTEKKNVASLITPEAAVNAA